jgi:hypothetical protein
MSTSTDEAHNIIEAAWLDQERVFDQIYQNGIKAYMKTIGNIEPAFHLKDRNLRCIDDGVPGGIHLPGAGIFLDKKEMIEFAKNAQIEGIYSHADCGACQLYAQDKHLNINKVDEYAKELDIEVAHDLGVVYKGHIAIQDMRRPSGLHPTRVIYYDGTGNFDYSQVAELPSGFTISRKYLKPKSAQEAVNVAMSIILGEHGFGNKITEEHPLLLVPMGDNFSLEQLNDELAECGAKYQSRVKIDGFAYPLV